MAKHLRTITGILAFFLLPLSAIRAAPADISRDLRPVLSVEKNEIGEMDEIYEALVLGTRDYVNKNGFERVVIGLSGGIDSALVGELCVRGLGKEKVLGLLLPEKESNPISLEYVKKQAEKIGIESITVDITEYLESLKV